MEGKEGGSHRSGVANKDGLRTEKRREIPKVPLPTLRYLPR